MAGRVADAEDEEVHASLPFGEDVGVGLRRRGARPRRREKRARPEQPPPGPDRHGAHQRATDAASSASARGASAGSPRIADRDQHVAQEPVDARCA